MTQRPSPTPQPTPKVSKETVIQVALASGFTLSTHHGQDKFQLMPVSDSDTLLIFARNLVNALALRDAPALREPTESEGYAAECSDKGIELLAIAENGDREEGGAAAYELTQHVPNLKAHVEAVVADEVEKARASAPSWVNVDEKLPKRGQKVLVYAPGYGCLAVSERETEAGQFSLEIDCGSDGYVTHWMPLPAPPSGSATQACIHGETEKCISCAMLKMRPDKKRPEEE